MEHKDASLAQLQSEHWSLRNAMGDMEARWAEEKAAHGHATAGGVAAELAQAREEESRLRASLQRCYADYTAAVDALTKEMANTASSAHHPDHHMHAHATTQEQAQAAAHHGDGHSAQWRSGGWSGEQRAPLWADDAEAVRYAQQANRY